MLLKVRKDKVPNNWKTVVIVICLSPTRLDYLLIVPDLWTLGELIEGNNVLRGEMGFVAEVVGRFWRGIWLDTPKVVFQVKLKDVGNTKVGAGRASRIPSLSLSCFQSGWGCGKKGATDSSKADWAKSSIAQARLTLRVKVLPIISKLWSRTRGRKFNLSNNNINTLGFTLIIVI